MHNFTYKQERYQPILPEDKSFKFQNSFKTFFTKLPLFCEILQFFSKFNAFFKKQIVKWVNIVVTLVNGYLDRLFY